MVQYDNWKLDNIQLYLGQFFKILTQIYFVLKCFFPSNIS